MKQLWDIGLQEYVNDMWNVIDFVTNSLYVATVALRVVSYFQVFAYGEFETLTTLMQFKFRCHSSDSNANRYVFACIVAGTKRNAEQ